MMRAGEVRRYSTAGLPATHAAQAAIQLPQPRAGDPRLRA